jgi:hypothetical protein
MAQTLLEHLHTVPDFRRGQGRRYRLDHTLTMIIMAIMSGRYGYREIASFLRANADALAEHLGLDRPAMPSHVTVRTILRGVDFTALAAAFGAWARQHLELHAGDLLAIDGKALGSTVQQYKTQYQDFICLVSVYAQRQAAVLAVARYHNGHSSELLTVEQLISTLGLRGITISVDALHCKKNTQPHP